MITEFYKYQGTGNDFIVIDDRDNKFDIADFALISSLCERRMGIGADGLILLRNHIEYDFEMIYFNSDGNQSSMCGNGGRCIIAFASLLGLIKEETLFLAVDGLHKGKLLDGNIALEMSSVNHIKLFNDNFLLNTGSPHLVSFVNDVQSMDVKLEGERIRNSDNFSKEGVNVNFVEVNDDEIFVRTYERGVENETLSCGTGVVAVAIALHHNKYITEDTVCINTLGGELTVSFEEHNGKYRNLWLTGDANMVFAGEFAC